MLKRISNKFKQIRNVFCIDDYFAEDLKDTFDCIDNGKYKIILELEKENNELHLFPTIRLYDGDKYIKDIKNTTFLFMANKFFKLYRSEIQKDYIKEKILNNGKGENK